MPHHRFHCDWHETVGVSGTIKTLCVKAVRLTLTERGFELPCEVSVCVVDEAGIRSANAQHRHVDAVTDVLSFPMLQPSRVRELMAGSKPQFDEQDPHTGRVALGDMIICFRRAQMQAQTYGHSIEREMAFLTVHGMLHLLGEDHENEAEETRMRALQNKVLQRLNLNIEA